MGYRWKPNATQRREYAERMKEKESLPTVRSCGAIRTGCKLSFYSVNKGCTISGEVIKHSYGSEKNQHTFTILTEQGDKMLVKGRNLYPNLLSHEQGQESINLN